MNLIANIVTNFFDDETLEDKDNKSINLFGIPSPDSLFVTLSPQCVKKIQYLYHFMITNDLITIDFYTHKPSIRRGNFPPKPHEINSFLPMKNGQIISKSEYIDFGEQFFDVFETQSSKITLDKFENKIKFQFIYFNGWTEEVFMFEHPLKEIII